MKGDEKPNLKLINKQMLEIKKKIQLSEGRRRATFEDCDAERKSNADEVVRLKKEIQELIVQLNETKKGATAMLNKRLEAIIGPFDEKAVEKVQELLDLQITDRAKALSLIRYRIKKHQTRLAELGKEYQDLLSEKSQKQILQVVDRPIRKITCDLQNSIHAVKVQLREASHVCCRYKDLKGSLLEDSACFKCNIQKIEEELAAQQADVNKLQQVLDEATRMKIAARFQLLNEEKAATAAANTRNKQVTEGKQLVISKRQQLEMLEKRIFQGGKHPIRPELDPNEEVPQTDDETPETPSQPELTLVEALEILKKATGGTDTQEVLKRFSDQKDTNARLLLLRKKAAIEKKRLEKQLGVLNTKFEHFKFMEFKEMERKSTKMEHAQRLIETQRERSRAYKSLEENKRKSMGSILEGIQELHLCIDPLAVPDSNVPILFQRVKEKIRNMMRMVETENEEVETADENEQEKELTAPYIGLIKRTPVPQTGFSPAPVPTPGSEDEDDVPSRTYLKRQAQLVVDAKSRRKNVRMLAKRS